MTVTKFTTGRTRAFLPLVALVLVACTAATPTPAPATHGATSAPATSAPATPAPATAAGATATPGSATTAPETTAPQTAGTSPAACTGGKLRTAFYVDMAVPDPDIFYETEGLQVTLAAYEGLLEYDQSDP